MIESSLIVFLFVVLVSVHTTSSSVSQGSAHLAASLLPEGIRAVKQKSAAHGFDPESVYGSIEGGAVKAYRYEH